MDTAELERAAPVTARAIEFNEADHPRGKGDQGGQFVPKGAGGGGSSPTRQPYQPPQSKPDRFNRQPTRPGSSPPAPRTKYVNTLKAGQDNDPEAVKQLQAMLGELGLGQIAVDGLFGPQTEAAVKAAQTKLGLKPTGTASGALMNRLHDAHTLSPCIDRAQSHVTASAGHHVPGEPYRFRHGWIPLAGAVLDDLFGAAVTMDGDDNEYVDHDEASHYDTYELLPGLNADLFDDGTILLTVPSAQRAGHSHVVHYLPSQDEASQLADDVAWAMFRDKSDRGHRPPDPINGLSDWRVSAEGIVVGFTPDGGVRIAFPDGNTGNVIAIDLTDEEARVFQVELGQVAETDIEGD